MSELLQTPKDKRQFNTWLKALRSGEYKQGQYVLQDSAGFCCLGVACKVVIPADQLMMEQDRLHGVLPVHQLGAPSWLHKVNGHFASTAGMHLDSLNDGGTPRLPRFTFDEIADVLEAVYVLKVLE